MISCLNQVRFPHSHPPIVIWRQDHGHEISRVQLLRLHLDFVCGVALHLMIDIGDDDFQSSALGMRCTNNTDIIQSPLPRCTMQYGSYDKDYSGNPSVDYRA